jgi:hypothetical protein
MAKPRRVPITLTALRRAAPFTRHWFLPSELFTQDFLPSSSFSGSDEQITDRPNFFKSRRCESYQGKGVLLDGLASQSTMPPRTPVLPPKPRG